MKSKVAAMACASMLAFSAVAFTTASKPSDGVYRKGAPEPSTVAVFLTGGQSNTEGRIPNSELPAYLAVNGRALVSNHSTVSDSTELGKFAAWAPTGKWAYDTEVYYQIAQALETEFYVVKTSYGGTSVSPSVNNSPSAHENAWLSGYGAGYHWSADADFLAATSSAGRTFEQGGVTYDGQSMLKAWIENIDASLDAIVASGKTPEVKAIIWHQGESDNNNGNYASDLTAVVTYIRQHVAAKLQNDDYLNLPFFCGNVPRRSSLFKVGLDRNFTAIEETSGNNMHVVDIYDLTMLSDNKHFDAASAITFGRRLFNRMVDEGVMEGEKAEVEDCVRAPNFGLEHVVNNTTTWRWDETSGDIATSLTDVDGMYFHGQNTNSRKFKVAAKGTGTVSWTIGEEGAESISKGAYTAWIDKAGNIAATTTAGDSSSKLYNMAAVNVGRAGAFEAFAYVPAANATAKLYCNGKLVSSATSETAGTLHLKATNAEKATYYIYGSGVLLAARFVPDEEMPEVSLAIGESGYGTFGNVYEANFALPEGVKAYAISPVDGCPTLLSMTEVGALNLGEAYVVKGAPGTYTLASGVGASCLGENLMVIQKKTGVVEATSGSDFINFMQGVDGSGKLVFTKSNGSAELAAGKAFFSITEGDEHSHASTLYTRDTSCFRRTGKGDKTLLCDAAVCDSAKSDRFYSYSYDEPKDIGNYDVTINLGSAKGPCASYVKFLGRRLAVDRTETRAGETKSVTFTARVPGPYTTRRNDEQSNRRLLLEMFCNAPQADMPAFEPLVVPAPDARTIYLCGDSTVTDQRSEPWGSWGQILPAFVKKGWTVSNFARSGLALKTFEGEGRLKRILEHLKKDDWVVIQFGHNDQKIAGEEPENGYTRRLNDWIDRIREKGAFVVLVTPVERRRFDEKTGEHGPKTLEGYANAMKSVAAAKSVPLVDLNDASYRMHAKMGAKGSCAIQCNNKGKIDNTHHNVYGAYEMARIVAAGLAEIPTVKDAIRGPYRVFNPENPDADPKIPPSGKTDYTKPEGS